MWRSFFIGSVIMLFMVNALIAAVVLGVLLVISELLWKRVKVHPELARKFVHITCGTFIAFLPFWVSYTWIMVLAIGFVIANFINRYVDFFHAIHAVRRKSWGDVLFGVGVFAVALFRPEEWVFTIALLQVSLADGLAAVAGVTYGKKHGRYYLFTQPKSIMGSAVFLGVSALTLAVGFLVDPYFVEPLRLWPVLAMLPLMLVCIENLAVFGTDNIFLPIATLAVLSLL